MEIRKINFGLNSQTLRKNALQQPEETHKMPVIKDTVSFKGAKSEAPAEGPAVPAFLSNNKDKGLKRFGNIKKNDTPAEPQAPISHLIANSFRRNFKKSNTSIDSISK